MCPLILPRLKAWNVRSLLMSGRVHRVGSLHKLLTFDSSLSSLDDLSEMPARLILCDDAFCLQFKREKFKIGVKRHPGKSADETACSQLIQGLWPASLQEVMLITVRFAFRPQNEQRIRESPMIFLDRAEAVRVLGAA